MNLDTEATEIHRDVMGTFARANAGELDALFSGLGALPSWRYVRKPETGLVMIRGRVSGKGAAFNFGEATVTRAIVALESGETGYAYALGRDREKARLGAIAHAMWQSAEHRDRIEAEILEPLRRRQDGESRRKSEETASTRVDFYTLVRGDD